MIEVHRIPCGNGNCYILEEKGNAVLVDTGKIEYQRKIEKQIRSFPVKLIVLTHAHFDHCQNAAYFSKLFQAPIAMHRNDIGLIHNQMKEQLSAKTILGKVVLNMSLASFQKIGKKSPMDFTPTIFFKNGDSLERYGIGAKIIGLSGHTKGSIGIDCGEAGILVGDALMNLFYPTISMLYEDKVQMQQSAEKIAKMGTVPIYFGHGKSVPNRNWVKRVKY